MKDGQALAGAAKGTVGLVEPPLRNRVRATAGAGGQAVTPEKMELLPK